MNTENKKLLAKARYLSDRPRICVLIITAVVLCQTHFVNWLLKNEQINVRLKEKATLHPQQL